MGQYNADLAAAAGATAAFGNSVTTAAAKGATSVNSLAKAAKVGTIALLGVGAGLAISAKAAIDFESSFAGVRKTVDTSEAGFQMLSDGIRNLAKTIPIGVNQLNHIAELGGQLGIQTGNLVNFTKVIAELGVSTNLSVDQAATGLARLANIMGESQTNFEKMGSSIVDLGNNFATTESEILTFALRIAPVGKVVGLTTDDVLALATAFSSVGVPAERGGTAIQRVFVTMASAVKSGNEQLASFAKTAGMTVDEFSTLFQNDAAQALNVFLQGLNRVEVEGGNVFAVLADVGLANVRTVQSLLALANAGGLLTDALHQSSSAWEDNMALIEEANKRFGTTASKMTIAGNKLTDVRIELGEHLLPVVAQVAEDFGNFVEVVADSQAWQSVIKFVVTLTAGMGALNLVTKAGVATMGLFGVELAGLAATGVGAALLVVGVAFGAIAKAAADARGRVDDWVNAMREGADAIDRFAKTSVELYIIQNNLAGAMALLGVSTDDMVDAMKGNSAALETIRSKAAAVLGDDLKGIIDLSEGQRDAIGDLVHYLDQQSTAYEKASHTIDTENKSKRELLATNYSLLDIASVENDAYAYAEELRTKGNGSIKLQNELLADQLQVRQDLLGLEQDSRGAAEDFIKAVQNLANAQAAFTKSGTTDDWFALSDAFDAVQTAAAKLGPDGIDPLLNKLKEMRAAGIITTDQFDSLVAAVNAFGPAAKAIGQGGSGIITTFSQIQDAAINMETDTWKVIQALYGLSQGMAIIIDSAEAFRQVMFLVMHPELGHALEFDTNYRQIANQIRRQWEALGKLAGTSFGDGASAGISGSSGGVTKSAEELAQDAVNAFIGVLNAQSSYDAAVKALADLNKKITDLQQEQVDLTQQIADKEKELEQARVRAAKVTLQERVDILNQQLSILQQEHDLAEKRKELAEIPQKIAEAQQALTQAEEDYQAALIRADRVGRQHEANMTRLQADIVRRLREYAMGTGTFADVVQSEKDLAEELTHTGDAADIAKQAEKTLAQARIDYENTLSDLLYRRKELTLEISIAEKELILAQKELDKIIKDSTGRTQEVIDLEKELKDLRDQRKKTIEDLADAIDSLQSAQLRVVSAYLTLMQAEAGLDPAKAIEYFQTIATQAGLTGDIVQDLIDKFRALGIVASENPGTSSSNTSGGGGGGGGTTSTTTTTTSGGGSTTTNTKTKYGGGGYQVLDRGGIVEGPYVGAPVPVIAHTGEMVFNPKQMSSLLAAVGGSSTIILQVDSHEVARFLVDDVERSLTRHVRTARRVN